MDMGVEPFLLSSSLVGVLAQRLVRTLCVNCRKSRPGTSAELEFLQEAKAVVFEAAGCEACSQTGFRGRTGIYEMLEVDDNIRQLIHDRASEQELSRYARSRAPSIREDGKSKVLAGATTVNEVMRVSLGD
jgi:general secretion pathway protein E